MVSVRRCAPTRPPGHRARDLTTRISGDGGTGVGLDTALRAYSDHREHCARRYRPRKAERDSVSIRRFAPTRPGTERDAVVRHARYRADGRDQRCVSVGRFTHDRPPGCGPAGVRGRVGVGPTRVGGAADRLAKGRVFHVKQPDKAEATASFSFDDTPLARELADLTARRTRAREHRGRALRPHPGSDGLEPEGRRRQDDDHGQPRGGARRRRCPRARHRPRSAGQRVDSPRGAAHAPTFRSVYDVLIDEFPLADIIQTSPESPNLLCAPSTIHLAGAEIELVSQVAREHRLRTALDDTSLGSTSDLDFVLIDCPPSLGLLTINAFTAAQRAADPDPVRVLRARGPQPAARHRADDPEAPQSRGCTCRRSCSRCTTAARVSRSRSRKRCASTSRRKCSTP